MAKKKRKKAVRKRDHVKLALERLRQALAKQTQADPAGAMLDLAREDVTLTVLRKLERRFDVSAPRQDLPAATRQAISDATDFDGKYTNDNFGDALKIQRSDRSDGSDVGQVGQVRQVRRRTGQTGLPSDKK